MGMEQGGLGVKGRPVTSTEREREALGIQGTLLAFSHRLLREEMKASCPWGRREQRYLFVADRGERGEERGLW